jgi:hypothetical protein
MILEFANTETKCQTTSPGSGQSAKSPEGPGRDGNKPLMQNRCANNLRSPIGSNPGETFISLSQGIFYVFASDLDAAIIKVGFTTNIHARKQSVQTSHPRRLNLLNEIRFPDYADARQCEAWIKQLLSPWQCDGGKDWYRPPKYLRDWVVCLDLRRLLITWCIVNALDQEKAHPKNYIEAEELCGIMASWFNMIGQRTLDARSINLQNAAGQKSLAGGNLPPEN